MSNIQNIQVSTHGAELTSLMANNREYIWQGDPLYWGRHAPILFPIVGRLANDTLRIGGKEYKMKQHGFARDAEFVKSGENHQLIGKFHLNPADCSTRLRMLRDERSANYPYSFDLQASYETRGNILSCSWEVTNKGENMMHFQIGAHPAFNLPDYNAKDVIHGYIQCYDANGKIVSPLVINYLQDGLRNSYGTPKTLLNEKAALALTNNLFANDAILIEGKQIASATLFDKHERRVLTVSCPQADAFGIWAPNKPGCPFVCIEPWCGIADRYNFDGDISERENDKCLAPNDTYLFNYIIEIIKNDNI